MIRRSRSLSIYANNKEDYLAELLKESKTKLCKDESDKDNPLKKRNIDFLSLNDNKIEESNSNSSKSDNSDSDEEDSEKSSNSKKGDFSNDNSLDEEEETNLYDNRTNEETEEEKILQQTIEIDNKLSENKSGKDQGLNLLCLFLKNGFNQKSNFSVFNKLAKNKKSLSNNDLYEINSNDIVNEILEQQINESKYQQNEEENNYNGEEISKNSNNNFIFNSTDIKYISVHSFFSQNIKIDNKLKLMFMSNNDNLKGYSIITSKKKYNFPFDITNKTVNLFNKKIALEILDTSDKFHNNKTSNIYYKLVNSFIFLIDATTKNSIKYIEKILKNIEKFKSNKPIIIIGVNMLFNNNKTIDDINLKKYALENNFLFYPLKLNELDIKNKKINKMLHLILMKKENNINSNLINSNSNSNNNDNIVNTNNENNKNNELNNINNNELEFDKFKVNNCVGFNKGYRVKYYDAFDMKEDIKDEDGNYNFKPCSFNTTNRHSSSNGCNYKYSKRRLSVE